MSGNNGHKYQDALKKASATIKDLLAENKALKQKEPIAVVGVGCRFPGGAIDTASFWNLLENQVDAVGAIPSDRWDVSGFYDESPEAPGKMYTRFGSFVSDVANFDAPFFGITPREADAMDPQQRILLETSWEAFEHAGCSPAKLRGSRTGVFIGQSNYDYIQAHIHSGDTKRITPYAGSGVMFSTNAGRLSYFYDFNGPCLTVDTACSSSLVSVYLAMKSLQSHETDCALAGGVNLLLSLDAFIALCKVQALSPDGRCRAFSNLANGYGRGEGCGLLVLKRLSDAVKDRNPVWAILKGGAVNHDGKSNGLTAPNGIAQQKVIRQALDDAGLKPEDVDYIEAHGTGTKLGDPIEFNALQSVYGQNRSQSSKLLIGSVKSNFGHTEASAGVAGLIKTILSLHKKKLPASLHCDPLNEHIDWEQSQVEIVKTIRDWNNSDHPCTAGVSSFGLSGTNAHLLLQEAPEIRQGAQKKTESVTLPDRTHHLLTLSAAHEKTLHELAKKYMTCIETNPDYAPADFGYSLARKMHLKKRTAIVGETLTEFSHGLKSLVEGKRDKRLVQPIKNVEPRKGIVFLYPGQGAQYVEMAQHLYRSCPVFSSALDRCDALLCDLGGPSLVKMLYPGDNNESAIHETINAQPALFAIEYALTELWSSWNIKPSAVIGHSIGEYAAANVSGLLPFEDGIRLAYLRGQSMQDLPKTGGMAVVFCEAHKVLDIAKDRQLDISIAAVNSPQCTTISGVATHIDRFLELGKTNKIIGRRLNVSHAFHSPLMHPMSDRFRSHVAKTTFQKSKLPLYSTVTSRQETDKTLTEHDYWIRQVLQPVQFYPAIQQTVQDGFNVFLEVGPSNTLTALVEQCPLDATVLALSSLHKERQDWEAILTCLSSLYVHGFDVDWDSFDAPYPRQFVDVPHYAFQRQRYWMELMPNRSTRKTEESSQPQPEPVISLPRGAGSPEELHQEDPAESTTDLRQRVLHDLLARLSEIGGFDPTQIDPKERLLEMGLDSLMLFKMGQEVEQCYHVELKISQFFNELASLEDLANYIVQHGVIDPPANSTCEITPDPQSSINPQDGLKPGAWTPSQTQALHDGSNTRIPNDYVAFFQQQCQQMQTMMQQYQDMLFQLVQYQASGSHPQPHGGPIFVGSNEKKHRSNIPFPRTNRSKVSSANFRGINLNQAPVLNNQQKKYIQEIVERHIHFAPGSKALTKKSRPALADWKHTLSFWGLLKEAKFPIVSSRSQGSRFWDVDDNEYIDLAIGMGVHFFGHNPPCVTAALKKQIEEGMELGTQCDLTGEVARLIADITGAERVTFCNTGSEAVMFTLRLARAATKRDKVVLFKQSYHGIFDGVLAVEEEGEIKPIGLGTTQGMVDDVYVLDYGADESLDFIAQHGEEIAGVLVEPVQSRNPDLQPQRFLRSLRTITKQHDIALIFDEMITGFRIHPGGAQAWFGIPADIVAYGKIVGGGMPIGVIAGKAKYLDYIDGGVWDYGDTSGPSSEMIYFGGTFGRNPMTMAAAHAILLHIQKQGTGLWDLVNRRTTRFCRSLNAWFEQENVPLRIKHFASQWRIVPLGSNDLLNPVELELLYLLLIQRGIYTWERRICFFSTEHTDEDVECVDRCIRECIQEIRSAGFAFESPADAPRRFTPPTSVQKRLYAISHRSGGELPYHLPQAFWIDGPLDIDRLEDSFAIIIQRHESLRTCFAVVNGEIMQYLVDEPRFSIERYESTNDAIDKILETFIRPFDLETPPLLRVGVVTVSPERHLLMADAHHIVVDGLSFNIIAQEFMALYNQQDLPAVPYQHRYCMEEQSKTITSEFLESEKSFWNDYLGQDPAVLQLPLDSPRPAIQQFAGNHIQHGLSEEVVKGLKTLAQKTGSSLYMVLLAAFNVMLHRLTGQEDILVGAPVSGRHRSESMNAVGMFVNTIVLRNQVSEGMTFFSFLESVKQSCTRAYDHQQYPFEQLVEQFSHNLDPSRNPLFDVMLSYENADARRFSLDPLTFEKHDVYVPTSMFDFSLDVMEEQNRLSLDFSYNTALFNEETVSAWIRSFATLIHEILSDPDCPVSRLPILSKEDQVRFDQWNRTEAEYPQKTIVDLFEEQVQRTPDRTAVIFHGEEWSYIELNKTANSIAAAIVERLRDGSGKRIAVVMEKSHRTIAVFLGILKAGCAYVPIDPHYPHERIKFMIEDSECVLGISCQEAIDALDLPSSLNWIEAEKISNDVAFKPLHQQHCDDAAYCIYTSGSSGRPKGCLISHRNVVRLLVNDRLPFDFSDHDVWITAHSFCFDFSVWEMYGALLYGGCVVVIPEEVVRDSHCFLACLRQHRVTILNQTPAAFYNLVETERNTQAPPLSSHLRYVIFGGDRLEPARLSKWMERYPLDEITLINMYGITETTVHVTFYAIQEDDVYGNTGRSPIGKPIPETRVYICNEAMQEQPIGVIGEIYVGGSGVCSGYINRPELTEEKFIPDPFDPGKRLYRTGDLGRRLADGSIEYIGRNDQQVQVRGYRVELGEVNSRLAEHPHVEKSLVLAQKNNSVTELVAYIVPRQPVHSRDLVELLSKKLPSYMIPSRFIDLEEFPLTANGKIDIKALRSKEWKSLQSGQEYLAPTTPVEKAIAEVWRDVLKLDRVGLNDNYFMVGGDSIKAILIVNRLYQKEIKISISDLLKSQTIAALAKRVKTPSDVRTESVMGPFRPTPIQSWFLENHKTQIHIFNQYVVLHAKESIDPHILEQTLLTLLNHHDALRIRLDRHPANYALEIAPPLDEFSIQVFDLHTSAHAREEQSRLFDEINQSFHLEHGPLLKSALFKMPEGDQVVLTVHHLAIDGVSWRILLDDFESSYQSLIHHTKTILPPKSQSYIEWSNQLIRFSENKKVRSQLDYWQAIEREPVSALPYDYPQREATWENAKTIDDSLSVEETELLNKPDEKSGTIRTMDLLLASLMRSLSTWKNIERTRIHLESHGREGFDLDTDVSRTVGWFTSLYPVLLQNPSSGSITDQILSAKRIRETVPQNGMGYGMLRYLVPPAFIDQSGWGDNPPIVLNYLGEMNHDPAGAFAVDSNLSGIKIGAKTERVHALEFECILLDGQARLSVHYNPSQWKPETMQSLLASWITSLREIIHTCQKSETLQRMLALHECNLDSDEFTSVIHRIGIVEDNVEAVVPLSPQQEGILFHALEDKASESYFEQFTYRIRGALDIDLFQASWNQLVQRHSILRTLFVYDRVEDPFQVILKTRPIEFDFHDWSDSPAEIQQQRLCEYQEKDRLKGFDLTRDPLMRMTAIRMASDSYEIVWSHHHIILDGWSMGILYQEFLAMYNSLERGQGTTLADAPQYAQYIQWRRKQSLSESLHYWEEYLKDFNTPTRFTDNGHQEHDDYVLNEMVIHLAKEPSSSLVHCARSQGVTMYSLLQTLWGIFLGHHCHATDVVFGSVVSGRQAAVNGIESTVGLLLNTVPTRIRYEKNESLLSLMQRVQCRYTESIPHHGTPLPEILAQSPLSNQLFNHVLVFENYPLADQLNRNPLQNGMSIHVEDIRGFEQMHYPFGVVVHLDDEIEIKFAFNQQVYSPHHVQQWKCEFHQLIEAVMADPSQTIDALLTAIQGHPKQGVANKTDESMPTSCVSALFEMRCNQQPDAIALKHDGHSVTYQTLHQYEMNIAHELHQKGLHTGDVVALFVQNGIEHVAGMLGTMKAGGVFMPVDVDSPVKRLEYLLGQVQPKVILTTEEHLHAVELYARQGIFDHASTHVVLLNHDLLSENKTPVALPDPKRQGSDPAYIIFTSGSTGNPKSIQCSHESLVHFLLWQTSAFPFDASVQASNLSPSTFDVSLREIFSPLISGGCVCIPTHDERMDIAKLLSWMEHNQITVLHVVPSIFRLFLAELEQKTNPSSCLNQINHIFFAGEALLGKDVERWEAIHPGQAVLVNLYGPSETTLAKLFHRIDISEVESTKPVLLGTPITGTRVFLLKDNRSVPPGIIGEICIQPPFPCLGYYGDQELTQQQFIRNPLDPNSESVIYRTGDLGRIDPEGRVEFVGRIDRQFKINGVRVELAEIDKAVQACPCIDQAVVTSLKKEDDQLALACYYTEKSPISPHELRDHLKNYLQPAMIPSYFIRLDSFPLNLNGKVNYKALPKPEMFLQETMEDVQPQNSTERRLEDIWKTLLDLKRVSVTASFFDIGGNSLKAMRLVARINKAFDSDLTIRDMFENKSIRELAHCINAQLEPVHQAIPTAPKRDGYPLSSAQRRLWIISQIQQDAPTYNIPYAIRLTGTFIPGIARQALSVIIQRHESLRTTFESRDGVPYQRIHACRECDLEIVDVKVSPSPLDEAMQQMREDAHQSFDLSQYPLFRTLCYRLDDNDYIFYFNIHHIIFDGWSLSVFINEFLHAYRCIAKELPLRLSPLRIQYKDYAYWESQRVENGSLEEHRAYWIKQLQNAPLDANLPLDYARPLIMTSNGARATFAFDAPTVHEIKKLCSRHNATLFMFLTAVIDVLLYRHTDQSDIIVGTPVSDRQEECLETQIGFFVNTLALRIRLEPSESFMDVLQKTFQTVTEAFEHQAYPFDRLIEELNLDRDTSRSPLFEVMLILQNMDQSDLQIEGVKIDDLTDRFETRAKYSLVVEFMERPDGSLHGNIEYNTDLFAPDRIERMTGGLRQLVDTILKEPRQPISTIDLVPASEKHQLEYAFSNTVKPLDHTHTIVSCFDEMVSRCGENTAVICDDRSLTYQELNQRANALAADLKQNHAINKGDRIAVLLQRSEWLPVAFLGVMKAGAVYVPIDPEYPMERIHFMIQDSHAACLLCNQELNHDWDFPHIVHIEDFAASHGSTVDVALSGEDLAYMIYTSGSTGTPKGVLLEHSGGVNLALFQREDFEISDHDRVLQFAPSSFDASVWEMLMALLNGASLVIATPTKIQQLHDFREYLKQKKITVATLPPSYTSQLREEDVADFRLLITAGEKARVEDLRRLSKTTTCINAYGPTETTVCATYHTFDPNEAYPQGIPIGAPIRNTEILILDANRQLRPIGVPGEIYIGGAGLARGYHQRETLNREKFVPHILYPGKRLYRTGDLGAWLPNGEIRFMGRSDFQVKVRGHRIECGEIEHVVSQHPNINQAVVTAHANGDQSRVLVGYYTIHDAVKTSDIMGFLAQRLPSYMIPDRWIEMEKFPLNPSGKIDRKALPAPHGQLDEAPYIAPRNAMQQLIANVWKEILQRKRVGIHERFFEAGGDSIKAIQMISRLRDLGYQFDLRDLYRYPSIEGMSRHVHRLDSMNQAEETYTGEVPLTPIQSWFFQTQIHDWNHFNQAILLAVEKEIDPHEVLQALNAVAAHHDVMRIRFEKKDKQWRQYYGDMGKIELPIHDLTHDNDPYSTLENKINEMQSTFALSQAPLLKAAWYTMHDANRILLVAHHCIVDGVSWRILLEDLSTALHQIRAGQATALVTPTASYRTWSRYVNDLSKQPILQQEMEYWKSRFQPNDDLIYDDRSTPSTYGNLKQKIIQLDNRWVEDFSSRAHVAYHTEANDLLLAALAQAMLAWKGKHESLLFLEHHGRECPQGAPAIDRTVGWFTSFFPFRLALPTHSDIDYQIKLIKESLRRIPQKGIGYGILKYLSSVDWDEEHVHPILSFNYLGQVDVSAAEGLIRMDTEHEPGQCVSNRMQCITPIMIEACILQGRFECSINYDARRFLEADIASLRDAFQEALQKTVDYCSQRTGREITPSDVSRVEMNLEEFNELFQD